ncbi:ribose-phosphate diphosphokinase [Chloroflexota bacterium]
MSSGGSKVDELKVFTGNAHPSLAKAVTKYLEIPLGNCEVFKFSNENTFVRILDNVRERDVFVIQPICSPVDTSLVDLLIMIDALKRASAGRITAVIPHYSYGRSDHKDQPRVPITARLVADLLTVAGANRVLAMDLHSNQIQGFFNIPVDELTALYVLTDYFIQKKVSDLVVVAADIGISKRALDAARRLNAPLAIIDKTRTGNDEKARAMFVIGDIDGKNALIFDDEVSTAGTLITGVNLLLERGAKDVYFCCTHPVFAGPAIERINESPVKEVVVTNTVPVNGDKKIDKITVLPIAPLLGEAIKRIHTGQSIGALFER